ncbi:MAG: hypothetical protein COA57_14565, partial [Flavobacteriales bacterium]
MKSLKFISIALIAIFVTTNIANAQMKLQPKGGSNNLTKGNLNLIDCFTGLREEVVSTRTICAGTEQIFDNGKRIIDYKKLIDPKMKESNNHEWVIKKSKSLYKEERIKKDRITHKFDQAGEYDVMSETKNRCGGIDRKIHKVTVLPNPNISVTPLDPTVCIGTEVILTAFGAVSYVWQDGTTGFEYKTTPTVQTTYTVTGTDGNGCSNDASTTVTVNATPDANFFTSVQCSDNPVDFFVYQSTDYNQSTATYEWDFESDGTVDYTTVGDLTASHQYAAGAYDVTLKITTANGCVGTRTAAINVNSPPVVNLGYDNYRCEGYPLTLNSGYSTGVLWSTGETTQTIDVTTTGTYSVVV